MTGGNIFTGCNALIDVSRFIGPGGFVFIFFCQKRAQGKFLTHFTKNAAPLHHFKLKCFIINRLVVVQRRVQEGAPWCNGGAVNAHLRALHHDLKLIQSSVLPQMVQWCNGKNTPKQFPEWFFYLIKWKKNTLFIYIFLVLSLWLERCHYRGLCYPVMGLCQPVLVTWLTTQTKGRNERRELTAHNYKECGKRIVQVHNINGSRGMVRRKSAVRNELPQFIDRDQGTWYPPPHQKFTSRPAARPPYLIINCSQFSNPFLFLVIYSRLLFLGGRGGHG
jgi:hypothetical protein